jgi:hypothetical protein
MMRCCVTFRVLMTIAVIFVALPVQSAEAPFTVLINSEQHGAKLNAEIMVRIILTNTSDQPIRVVDTTPNCDYELNVTDAQGNPAPTTERGRMLAVPNICLSMPTRAITLTVKPNGVLSEGSIWISDLYDLRHPGQYTIQVQRKISKELGYDVVVKSNTITVTVN